MFHPNIEINVAKADKGGVKINETSFRLYLQAISGIECILYAVAMALFYRSLTVEKQNKKKRLKVFFIVFTVYMAGYPLNLLSWFYGWMHILLTVGALTLLSGYLEMERNFVFLLGVLFYCIRCLAMMAARSLDYFTNEWALSRVDTPEQIFLFAAWNYLFVAAAQFLLCSLLLALTKRRLKESVAELHAKELCLLLLTPAAGILFTRIILRLLVIGSEDHYFRLYDRFPLLTAIVPAVAALFYAGVLASIASWQKIIVLQEEQSRYFVSQQQIAALQERIREVEAFHESIRQMKHEMKNHLTNIKGLAESGHYEDMENYIARMADSISAFELAVHTGNAVTDVIVNDCGKAAAALNIPFQCEFVYPSTGCYDAYDIGIILNNLLQNALEACEKLPEGHRRLSLLGGQKKKFFLIEVDNSFDGEINYDPNTLLPLSTKKPGPAKGAPSLHGIGLSNVRREAAKYRGNVDISTEGGRFRVTVLLQERRQP